MFPCNECAKVIIQSGVSEVIYFVEKSLENSDVIYAASHKLLSLAGIKVSYSKLLCQVILQRLLTVRSVRRIYIVTSVQ
ncbi:putative dCMP deaminase [Helianthus annuus]|nr:putative dCMP deaminase [Helianthus annuus]